MKVFISSVIRGLEGYREAATRAARALRHEVKRAEDFAASSATPQQTCLAGARWAEVVILILGARYGDRQTSGLSPTHEEYREAREYCPVLVFIQQNVDFEAAQQVFVREVQDWSTGHFTARFSNPDELRDEVTAALRDLELSRAAGPIDEEEMLSRAKGLLPAERQSQGVRLSLVVAGGPKQQVIRPKDLEASKLEEAISQQALFGPHRILDRTLGTDREIRDNALVIEQQKGSIFLDQLGTIRLVRAIEHSLARNEISAVGVAIKEEVEELLRRMLQFAAWMLDHIDPVRRISDVVPVVALNGAMTWRTQAEHEQSPNSYPVRLSTDPVVAQLNPARRHRAALTQDAASIAEDIVALLGRSMRR